MAETTKTSSGVQELIDRIRDQGVQAAQEEADRLLRDAQATSAEIVATAKAEAEATQAKARTEIEAYRLASMDASEACRRDTVLDLKARVMSRFEEFVQAVGYLGHARQGTGSEHRARPSGPRGDEFIKDKEIEVRLSSSLLEGQTEPVFKEEGKLAILGLSSDMLREGLELVSDSDIEGGARVRLVQDKLEIDLRTARLPE